MDGLIKMKGKILSLIIVVLIVVGSFGVIGTQSEKDCNCTNNYLNIPNEKTNERYATGIVGELRNYPDKEITFLGNPPTTFSWNDYGGKDYTTGAKSQGQCGSCYAFAAIGVVESNLDIQSLKYGLNKDLSEQYIVSCASEDLPQTVSGCDGAVYTPLPGLANFIDWTRDNDVVTESCFPYTSGDGNVPPCNDGCPKIADVVGWGWVDSSNRLNIKNALLTQGPLTASMLVYDDFQDYSGGIYFHNGGGSSENHLVSIVGYNDDDEYWICKNSWGTSWGEDGFFRILYANCGIEDHIAFIEVDYGSPTETKNANQCYDYTNRWEDWGAHGMQCDNHLVGGPDYIYYKFDVPKDSPGPIIIGIEFDSDLYGANGGPDLEVLNPSTSDYDPVRKSMGDPGALKWKWFVVGNDYISTSNQLEFRILCAWGCHAYIDDVAVKYTTAPPPEPKLDAWSSPSPFRWTSVESGGTRTGTITVKNIGDSGSVLNWRIVESLNWVYCDKTNGNLQKDQTATIKVSVTASSTGGDTRSGTIVVDSDPPGGSKSFTVEIITKKGRERTLFFDNLKIFEVRFAWLITFLTSNSHFNGGLI